ncbi:PD40 domain-containing protein [Kordiimonas lacus]|uniref:WD40-like Beta Propeller Repeat n=1 Tax=Kordiimonas lacus TaxID=637679 RepID=A0A1G7A7E5_9PROT|nr:PD40 domain-containing protein [Kordiimonas lacus]SDE10603.1 WD40-like Beta Propeller Repeat [Kordiimonas lacus]
MKRLSFSIAFFLASAAVTAGSQAGDRVTGMSGPYVGQTPPGDTPIPFAPGIVSTDGWEYGLTFMPDMKEAYFLRNNADTEEHELMRLWQKGGAWHKEVMAPRLGQPVISADGKTMHLGRRYRERTQDGWSDVKMLDAPFSEFLIMRMSSSASGTLYFDTYDENNESFPVRFSRMIDGKRETPQALGAAINTGVHINHPFIAPDESYLIFDVKRDSGYGNSDIYISYRQKDGSWGGAINLGDKINTPVWEAAAGVTPDGKYLFFNRNVGSDNFENVDIFWVSAGFIEDLRPKN